jgi:hypothetical protein
MKQADLESQVRPTGSSTDGFVRRFAEIADLLGLAQNLDKAELDLLREAAFLATLCNIAFNGLGGCAGTIKPEREITRIRLEWRFMAARDEFQASAGWRRLSAVDKQEVQSVFLKVVVAQENLAS